MTTKGIYDGPEEKYLITVKADDGSSLVAFRVNARSFTEAAIKAVNVLSDAAEPDKGHISTITRDSDGRVLEME